MKRMKKIQWIFFLILCFAVILPVTAQQSSFDVRDFGARGDGKTKDTQAIQKAVDACTSHGGGTVIVPPGTYIIGSIFLKNNVDFYIMSGALLQGSPDKEDYNKLEICSQNRGSIAESSSGAHLILCIEQKNVTLRGPGRIDGNSSKFLIDPKGKPYPGQDKIPWRPSQMLYFVESDNIRVQDIELTNSTYWTSFYHGCTHLFIRGIKIQNSRNPHTHNGDGIDIDCCEYVTISDCQIDSADDCITLRGHVSPLKTKRPCRYVTITNCILSTPCNCFRFGVGDGEVRNITISNIVVENARTAFNFVSSWSKTSRGVDMSDIRINNICVDCEILVNMYHKFAEKTELRNVSITGVTGTLRQVTEVSKARRDESCIWLNAYTPWMVAIEARPDCPFQNIRFTDINLNVFPKAQWIIKNVNELTMENIVLKTVDPAKSAEYMFTNVTNFYKNGRIIPGIPDKY